MEQFKLIIKETKPISFIIAIISTGIIDSSILHMLDKMGYVQWLAKLTEETMMTLTSYENFTYLKCLKVMGMDILGVISCLAILYFMFYIVPNIIADVMGPNANKAGDTDA